MQVTKQNFRFSYIFKAKKSFEQEWRNYFRFDANKRFSILPVETEKIYDEHIVKMIISLAKKVEQYNISDVDNLAVNLLK